MDTKTDRIQIDGSGNAYLITPEGPDYIGSWNPSLRQFTFDDGDVWDVDPTTDIEIFLASFPTADEAAEAESLMDRGELIDLGLWSETGECAVCGTSIPAGERDTCNTCASYEQWRADSGFEVRS